jgi:hypothetical protein
MVFIVFVLGVAACCFKFGQALNFLNHKYRARRCVSSRSDVGS